MTTLHEKPVASKDAPSDSEIARIRDLLTRNSDFFMDRELLILLTRSEASQILGIPIDGNNIESNMMEELLRIPENFRQMCCKGFWLKYQIGEQDF